MHSGKKRRFLETEKNPVSTKYKEHKEGDFNELYTCLAWGRREMHTEFCLDTSRK